MRDNGEWLRRHSTLKTNYKLAVGTFVPQLLLGLTQSLAAFLGPGLIVLSGAPVQSLLKIFLVCCLLRSCLSTRSRHENMCRAARLSEFCAGDSSAGPEAWSTRSDSVA